MNEEVLKAALAGLLHDVGKFAQRAEQPRGRHTEVGVEVLKREPLAHLIPMQWEDDVRDAIAYHHGGDVHKNIVKQVRVADWLAASERFTALQDRSDPSHTPLTPVAARVSLVAGEGRLSEWGYSLPSANDGRVQFPQKGAAIAPRDYAEWWEKRFVPLLGTFPGPIDSYARMAGLLDVLAETTACMPSATPWERDEDERTIPDVPLYNHLHLTAAIATCLAGILPDDLDSLHSAGREIGHSLLAVARLVKVDFSGIQSFIYRISEPSSERVFRNAAKRLRGRSLHLTLLNRAVGDWLLRQLDMPPTNLVYAGGGVIELLLPPDGPTQNRLQTAMQDIETAFWNAFGGALGIVWANALLTPGDFANISTARTLLEEELGARKSQKWARQLSHTDTFEKKDLYHVCSVCGLTPMPESRPCPLCEQHKNLGGELPHAFALVSATTTVQLPGECVNLPEPLQGTLTLVQSRVLSDAFKAAPGIFVQGVARFPESADWPDGSAPGRWNLANAAPVLDGEVCGFEEIAAFSRGASLLGVLKADADRMGLLFSKGIHPATFSRSVALSQAIARFFGEYLNELAGTLTQGWHASLGDEQRQTIERRLRALHREPKVNLAGLNSLFYVLYAGGDDLFVVGPWDALIDFALALHRQYRAYTCENDLFSLSAGLVLVKPHFPIQQFSRLVDRAEKKAKDADRNRLTLFGQALPWSEMEALVGLGKEWAEAVSHEQNPMPRGLLHDLGRLSRASEAAPTFTPTLYYTLARRLRGWDETQVRKFGQQVLQHFPYIKIPVSFASLITRKE